MVSRHEDAGKDDEAPAEAAVVEPASGPYTCLRCTRTVQTLTLIELGGPEGKHYRGEVCDVCKASLEAEFA